MESQQHADATRSGPTRRRSAALGLVLALLAVLAIATTANAFVARLTETTVSDFDSGIFHYTGLLDIPPDIHSVQLLPVGLTGDWHTSAMTMPRPLANFGSVLSGDRIYVVGGTDDAQDARREVYSYDVGADGALSPPQPRTAMPELHERAAAGVTIYDPDGASPVLYVVGGFDTDFNATSTIYRAPINPTSGEVGPWVLDSQELPSPLESPMVAVHGDWLYIIGGWDSDSDVVLDKVHRASIGASGALGGLVEVETERLLDPLFGGVVIVYEGEDIDTLYLMGGRDQDASTAKVYFADIQESGALTEWTESAGVPPSLGGSLPVHLFGHRGVFTDGQIVLTGGYVNAVGTDAISSTVKAALVDPTNTELRLYDWCEGAPPDCTIGAWQTGGLLPEDRALHGAVTLGDYIYVLGGQDSDGGVRDSIFYGTVDGAGAVHRSSGRYTSDEIDLGQEATLLDLEWDTTISRPDEMGLTMQYRYSLNGLDWVEWSAPESSGDGFNYLDIIGDPEDVLYFQYQVNLTTTAATASPRLNSVDLYYRVPDPDLAVIKDTGTVISAELGSTLAYTITYSNSGGWTAKNAVLTEVLPENTTFAGSEAWHQVGASGVYTYPVGDVGRGQVGTAGFRVRVNDEVPDGTEYITNVVSIDYPTMTDFRDNSITDPFMGDNEYEFSNPLSFNRAVDLAITDLYWYPALTAAGMWPRFCITVTNFGNADLGPPPEEEVNFWLELYIKPSPSEPPEWPSDHDWGYCLDGCTITRTQYVADFSQPLAAGEAAEEICFEPPVPEDPLALDYPAEGFYDIYAQVDVAFVGDSVYWGRQLEGNEENNVAQDTMELIDVVYDVYLPVVLKGAP